MTCSSWPKNIIKQDAAREFFIRCWGLIFALSSQLLLRNSIFSRGSISSLLALRCGVQKHVEKGNRSCVIINNTAKSCIYSMQPGCLTECHCNNLVQSHLLLFHYESTSHSRDDLTATIQSPSMRFLVVSWGICNVCFDILISFALWELGS